MQLEFHQLDMRYEQLRVNDGARQRRLVGALAEHGQQQPVLVVADGERYVLIDGYRRVRALRRLGHDTVEAVVLSVAEPEALVLRYALAAGQRWSALEEAWLVCELVERHGVSQGELATRLGRSASWISRRLGLVRDLPPEAQQLVRAGRICAHAAMKYFLPLARAKKADCLALVAGVGTHSLTERQVRLLYLAWRRTDATSWATIAANPLLYLKTVEPAPGADAPEPEPVGETAEQALDRELSALGGACWRVRKRVGDLPAEQAVSALAWRAFRAADKAFCVLRTTMEERRHAGPSDAQRDPCPAAAGARVSHDSPGSEGVAEHGQEGAGKRLA